MPDLRRRNCRHCGGHDSKVGAISWSGSCQRCAIERLTENINGIHNQRGIPHQRRRMGYARQLFGPEATEVLARAGYFRDPVDEPAESR